MKKSKFTGLAFDTVEILSKEQKAQINGGDGYWTHPNYNSGYSGDASSGSSPQHETFGHFVCRWGNGWLWTC